MFVYLIDLFINIFNWLISTSGGPGPSPEHGRNLGLPLHAGRGRQQHDDVDFEGRDFGQGNNQNFD